MALERLNYELIEGARLDHRTAMEAQRELLGRQHWVDPVRALHVVHAMLDQRVSSSTRLQESAVAHGVLHRRLEAPDALDPRTLPREGWKEKLKWLFVDEKSTDVSAFTYAAKWQLASELMSPPCTEEELADLCEFDRQVDGQLTLELPLSRPDLHSLPRLAMAPVIELSNGLPFSA